VKVISKYSLDSIMKWVWRIWCLLYFIILFYVVFFAGRRPSATWGHRKNPLLQPFRLKWYLYRHAGDVSSVYLDIIGNIVMFTPLPLFLYIVFGFKHYGGMIILGFVLSLCIETCQFVLGIGIPDIDDLIFNSLGTILGALIIQGIKLVNVE